MKLHNVRKGQFVYFNNELHRVYSVKAFFKKSVHLVRLKDLEQRITRAEDIELYKPQHLDSFVYRQNRYTLRNDKRAEKGDHILIIRPNPDSLDHYTLHAIEEVSVVEKYGVITANDNGVRHNEYWLLAPGREENARVIDVQHSTDDVSVNEDNMVGAVSPDAENPNIGDVYEKVNSNVTAMVVAVNGEKVILGGNIELSRTELADSEQWNFLYNLLDQ